MSTQAASASRPGRLSELPRAALLRLALQLDAVITGANGIAYLAGADALDSVLGVPAGFLRAIGAFLILFAVAVWAVATRPQVNGGAVATIVAANLAWALASVVFAAAGWHDPTTGGTVWIVLQASVVAGFAALQLWTLRHR